MIKPPTWTSEQLELERVKSTAIFSKERLEEPLEDYLEAFDRFQGYVEEVLEATVDLTEWETSALHVLGDQRLLEAFRYLAAPPISADDLKVLADASSLSSRRLRNSPADVQRLISVVRQVLDRRRFAWIVEGREPTEAERDAAVLASAALMAASRTQTNRRTKDKKQQEAALKEALRVLGFTEVAVGGFPLFRTRLMPANFVGKASLGSARPTSSCGYGISALCRSSARSRTLRPTQ